MVIVDWGTKVDNLGDSWCPAVRWLNLSLGDESLWHLRDPDREGHHGALLTSVPCVVLDVDVQAVVDLK